MSSGKILRDSGYAAQLVINMNEVIKKYLLWNVGTPPGERHSYGTKKSNSILNTEAFSSSHIS